MTAAIGAPLVVERVGRDNLSLRALAKLRMTVFRTSYDIFHRVLTLCAG